VATDAGKAPRAPCPSSAGNFPSCGTLRAIPYFANAIAYCIFTRLYYQLTFFCSTAIAACSLFFSFASATLKNYSCDYIIS